MASFGKRNRASTPDRKPVGRATRAPR
jgi:hypothetical protein